MKTYNIKNLRTILAVAAIACLASCSDDFLQEKRDYGKVGPEIYNDFSAAEQRVTSLYKLTLPHVGGAEDVQKAWQYVSTGKKDNQSTCTEEYSDFGTWVNPERDINVVTGNTGDMFQLWGEENKVQGNPYGMVRSICEAIDGVSNGTLSNAQKNELLGQLYFLRAWTYFKIVRWMGSVPLVDRVLPIEAESITPRSSAKECFEFIVKDLNTAADLLQEATGSGQWLSGSKYGRVTTGTALAMKGRVLTWWCSPLFNRSGNKQRYIDAYNEMKADLDKIQAGGYGLMPATGSDNYEGWARMFQTLTGNTEAIFLTRYNNINGSDYSYNNSWENDSRPANAKPGDNPSGGITPSAMIVDIFPMRDGGVPSSGATNGNYFANTKLKKTQLPYSDEHPFLNRDPRFYRTFGFPGIKWPYNGSSMGSGHNPFNGQDYELWNYVWYKDDADVENPVATTQYGADNLGKQVKGMYVSKRSTGKDGLYDNVTTANNGFAQSYASYIELRFAEVLLNLAEVACGAGEWQSALENYLKPIRQRVGYTGDCGFNVTDDASCMAAILYERQIELAFEGKRFDDMRRWLLFDGGAHFAEIPGAPSTWTLSGWGGNTCTWLGFKEFNGQHRDNMEFRVKINNGKGGDAWGDKDDMPDPIAKELMGEEDSNITGWDTFLAWRSQYAVDLNNSSDSDIDAQLDNLQTFYNKYLTRKLKTSDLKESDKNPGYITYKPRYYLVGLNSRAQVHNKTLEQTIGWEDSQRGGTGTYDPLAE